MTPFTLVHSICVHQVDVGSHILDYSLISEWISAITSHSRQDTVSQPEMWSSKKRNTTRLVVSSPQVVKVYLTSNEYYFEKATDRLTNSTLHLETISTIHGLPWRLPSISLLRPSMRTRSLSNMQLQLTLHTTPSHLKRWMDLPQASFTYPMSSTHYVANEVSLDCREVSEDHGCLKEVVLSEACNIACRSSRTRNAQFRTLGYCASTLPHASGLVSEAKSDPEFALI